jgi:RNA polymerase sigma factor (sigma-70 family)
MHRKTVTNGDKSVHTNKDWQNDDPVIRGILNNDNDIIRQIYQEQFDKIRNMVKNFRHINLDAGDVFQEGLTRAMLNIRGGRFKGDSNFSTYLYGICRNICLKEYHRNKDLPVTALDAPDFQDHSDHFELMQIILQQKNKLDEKCRRIIDLRFGLGGEETGHRFETIAEMLGIKPDNARQRYGRCFARLLELLRENKDFNLLIDGS